MSGGRAHGTSVRALTAADRSSPKRVLFVSHSASLRGGAERSLFELLSFLKRDGRIEPLVTVPDYGTFMDAAHDEEIECWIESTPTWTRRPTFAPRARGALDARYRQARGLVWNVRRMVRIVRGLPRWVAVLRKRRPDVVVTNTSTVPSAGLAAAIVRIPHVWWVHEFLNREMNLIFVLGGRIGRRAIGWLSNSVIAASRAVACEYSPPIPGAKLRVIYCGVESRELPENQVEPGLLRLLLLGRQRPEKGCELAVRGIAALQHEPFRVELRLVGPIDARYKEHLTRIAADSGVADRVQFLGYTSMPREQIVWANAVLVCSDVEGFGRVTAEALASGRPVVGTQSGGTAELVRDGVDGLLYRPGDVHGLALALRRLGRNPELVRSMSRRARSRNAHRFTVRDQGERFLAAVEALLER